MKEILTIQQIAKMYNLNVPTVRVYVDGYRLAKFRKSRTSIEWCDESKAIVEELASRKRKDIKKACLSTRVNELELEVEKLKCIIAKLLEDK